MGRAALVSLLMLGTVVPAFGQTSTDLSAKYRQIISYEVRPGVVLTPTYAPNGLACEMDLEKRQKMGARVDFDMSFSKEELKELVDELVPEAERGRNLTGLLNGTVDGGFITTEYTYGNILVRVYGITRPGLGGDRVVVITWPKRVCSGVQHSATARSKPIKHAETVNVKPRIVASNGPKAD